MRIIIPSIQVPFIIGGARIMTEGLASALRRGGHEVEVVTAPFKFFPEGEVTALMDFWCGQDFNSFNGYRIDKVIALQFPAYYVGHDNKTLWLMHQHRAVYELYDGDRASPELKSLRARIHRTDSERLPESGSIFSMSHNVAARLKKNNGIDAVTLYHPPFGEDEFCCEEPYDYIFYPSRLEALKRQDLLIEGMRFARGPVKAIITGEGGQRQRYERLIEEFGLGDRVKLIGEVSEEEKRVLYARCLAVFFGPYDEDYGYVTLEAMLSSKPVITCTDSGGPLEFVIDGETGLVVEPRPEAVGRAIDQLRQDRVRATQMGRNGLSRYRATGITWERVVETLMGGSIAASKSRSADLR